MRRLLAPLALLLAATTTPPQSPAELFGDLYARVETLRLFPDGKTFADAQPRRAPAAIMAAYRAQRPADAEALRAFVAREFVLPPAPPAVTLPPLPLREHIARLWPILTRPPLSPPAWSSALPLVDRYVVPGGRFREIYYWDSYFTMLGLVRDGRRAEVEAEVRSFEGLIARYGHIPNGSRTYYLSRSQPPFFWAMVALTDADPAAAWARHLPALKAEHAYWMRGGDALARGSANGHVVRLADGTLLNRYWDAKDTPRDESYAEDAALAKASSRAPAALYRDLRAAAESGWDFSSRWLTDARDLATIRTTDLAPVDLNALLYGLEDAIAKGCARAGDRGCAADYAARAQRRAAAIERVFWHAEAGTYDDIEWRTGRPTGIVTAATLMPLFVGVASPDHARRVARRVEETLVRDNGLATTTRATGQQWDEPNGWAPLQWIAVAGLDRYGQRALADTIATRWVRAVAGVYRCTGRLVEKYDVDGGAAGGGGEYPVQDGFGWTNGVTRALLDRPGVEAAGTGTAPCPIGATGRATP